MRINGGKRVLRRGECSIEEAVSRYLAARENARRHRRRAQDAIRPASANAHHPEISASLVRRVAEGAWYDCARRIRPHNAPRRRLLGGSAKGSRGDPRCLPAHVQDVQKEWAFFTPKNQNAKNSVRGRSIAPPVTPGFRRRRERGTSGSVLNQHAMIRDFAAADANGRFPSIVAEYSDDGFLGLTFENRPDGAASRRRGDRQGRPHRVGLTWSRLGRNYLDVSRVTHQVFPAPGVRGISPTATTPQPRSDAG